MKIREINSRLAAIKKSINTHAPDNEFSQHRAAYYRFLMEEKRRLQKL